MSIILFFSGEWKPIFNNTSTSKERISIIQIAFPNEIFLLDVLDFFRKDVSEKIQQRLADRLFDDDHVTILCKFEKIFLKKKFYKIYFRLWF
jgi:hypothetical protein